MAAKVAVEEKLPLEFTTISENKLKYINKQFVKRHADLYDTKCDLKIMVGKAAKVPFHGHTEVLKHAHEYFGEMFYNHGTDGLETYFKEITAEGFSAMFEYFYHGCITMEPRLFPDILEAAAFFKGEWVLDACCDYMVRSLSTVDYPLTVMLADKYELGYVRNLIHEKFGDYLSKVANNEMPFKDCSKELLLDFLQGNIYINMSELQLLQFVLKWIEWDEKKRKEHRLALLLHIRFHVMELEELKSLPQDLLALPEIHKEVEDAKRYCSDMYAQCLKQGSKYLTRGAKQTVVVSAFSDNADLPESNMVGYKDPYTEDDKFVVEELGPSGLTADYTTMNQAQIGNFLFAAGGYDKDSASCAGVFRYDTRSKKWTEVARMAQARVSFAMCSSSSRLYAIGGVCNTADNAEILSSAEMYVPEVNAWQTIASLPSGCFNQAAVNCGDMVYVSGGIEDSEPISSAISLKADPAEWTPLPDMSVCRQGHSMTSLGAKIYVLGGYTSKPNSPGLVADCNVNEEFDLETKQWTTIISTPEHFGHLYRHTGLVQNKIYFLCNRNSDVYISNFDTDHNEFNSGLLVGRGVHKVSVLQIGYSRA